MTDFDLDLPSGRVRARRWGRGGAPPAICVHGLSANVAGFAWLGEQLGGDDRQLVAFDLRGRGRSEVTPPGSYGLESHARDVLHVADALGADTFDLVGWSLGGLIGIHVAALDAERLRTLTLVDVVGPVDPAAADAVRAGLARLDAVVAEPEAYVGALRSVGHIAPWSPMWDAFYRYELEQRDDGSWSPSTSRRAAEEDLDRSGDHDWPALWAGLTMPVALVRALAPLGGGHVVPADARDAFMAAVPHARLTETDSGHFTVIADPATRDAIRDLLGERG